MRLTLKNKILLFKEKNVRELATRFKVRKT